MSGLFGDDEDHAVEKLKRAGSVGDRTIFSTSAKRAEGVTGKTILAALSKDGDGGVDQALTPDDVVDKRFPKPHQQMPTYKLEELGPGLREEFERFIGEQDEREAEELQRDWPRRLLFDPRPLRGSPGRFVPRLRPPSRFANRGSGRPSA